MNQKIRIYDYYLADIPVIPDSHVLHSIRPVLVVSTGIGDTVVTVVPLTTRVNKFSSPTHVLLQGNGLIHPSLARCEQVMAIDTSRFIRYLGHLEHPDVQASVRCALRHQLGLTA